MCRIEKVYMHYCKQEIYNYNFVLKILKKQMTVNR